jgi:hypothetical protein
MMKSSLVSYAKRDIFETIPGMLIASYSLPASQNGIPTILHVDDSAYYKPDLDGNQDSVYVPSSQIVESIVHMHITSQLNYRVDRHPALFAIPNEEITFDSLREKYAATIAINLQRQKAWFASLVQLADDDWQQAHRHNMISDIQRTAAMELGLEREWLVKVQDEEERRANACPFCGTGLLNVNAPICPTCGKVHNPARLKEIESIFAANSAAPKPATTTK